MPPAINMQVRGQVIREWFSGLSRDEIDTNTGVGTGRVSNIISEFRSELDDSEYESIRELAVHLKKEGMTHAQLASNYWRHNYVKKLGANEEQIESLIANLLDGEVPSAGKNCRLSKHVI